MHITTTLVAVVCLLAVLVVAQGQSCSAAAGDTTELSFEQVEKELVCFKKEFGLERPFRLRVDQSLPWIRGMPNYARADLEYLRGRSRNHSIGSEGFILESRLKQWEMEASHRAYKDWTTVSKADYKISISNALPLEGEATATAGHYNAFLASVDSELYDASNHTSESSRELFGAAFPNGFPWELIEVISSPRNFADISSSLPRIIFSWRHWARFTGTYRGRDGDGKTYELYGIAAVTLCEAGKITSIELYYKPEEFLRALQGEVEPDVLRHGMSIFGSGLPIAEDTSSQSCSA